MGGTAFGPCLCGFPEQLLGHLVIQDAELDGPSFVCCLPVQQAKGRRTWTAWRGKTIRNVSPEDGLKMSQKNAGITLHLQLLGR